MLWSSLEPRRHNKALLTFMAVVIRTVCAIKYSGYYSPINDVFTFVL